MRGWSCCRTVTAPLSFLTRGEHSALPNALAGIQISPLRRNSLVMPEDDVTERAREDEREKLSPSTQTGEFVREEWSTSVRENTARDRHNRLSRLVCRKRVARV